MLITFNKICLVLTYNAVMFHHSAKAVGSDWGIYVPLPVGGSAQRCALRGMVRRAGAPKTIKMNLLTHKNNKKTFDVNYTIKSVYLQP